MTILLCWLAFPLLLATFSLGLGLLLERLAGVSIPGAFVVPVGFAGLCVVVNLATMSDSTAELSIPVSVGLAAIGLGLGLPVRLRLRDCWPAVAGVATYLAFLLPVLTSGKPTFAGYIRLDDTSTWLGMTDWMLEHGRSTAGLASSSYEAMLSDYVDIGAPAGAFLPLGVVARLIGEDIAFVFQPYTAFAAAMLALSLYGLLSRLVRSDPLRALAAFVAAQPAVFYGYSLWGGIKEIVSGALVALAVALVPLTVEHALRPRALLPLAVVCAAALGSITLGGAVWLAVPLAAVLVLARRRFGLGAVRAGLAFVGLLAVLTLPTIVVALTFLRRINENDVLRSADELGNLIEPLNWLQVLGVWPTGDFRLDPGDLPVTYVLLAAAVVGILAGLWHAWRRGAWEVPLYLLASFVGLVAVALYGSPWVDAKGVAIAAPAFLALAVAGLAAVFESGRRVEAAVLAAAVVGGVGWSNGLAFQEALLAPYDHHRELLEIGERFEGEGPALMTEYEQYGVRHFLRDLDPEGAGSLRRRTIPLRSGETVERGGFADIDQFQLDAVLVYQTLVLRRSPVSSRPPSAYERVWSGRYYEVWQRPEPAPRTIASHEPFGNELTASTRPACGDVLAVAAAAGSGRVAAFVRPPALVVALSGLALPTAWRRGDGGSVVPERRGVLEMVVPLQRRARYGIWVAGSFRGRLVLRIDGEQVGALSHELNWRGQWTPLAERVLERGSHRLTLDYGTSRLVGGSGGEAYGLGPLAVATTGAGTGVTDVAANEARRFCGRELDWVEALP